MKLQSGFAVIRPSKIPTPSATAPVPRPANDRGALPSVDRASGPVGVRQTRDYSTMQLQRIKTR